MINESHTTRSFSFSIYFAEFLADFDVVLFGNKPLSNGSGFWRVDSDVNLDISR
jgi:hypothetical protein